MGANERDDKKMALTNAQEFLKRLKEDEALQKRMAGLTREEGLAAAKEMGLDFTLEELKETAANRDLPMWEMEKIAGGYVNRLPDNTSSDCPNSPNGKHSMKEIACFTEYLIVRHHIMRCIYCDKSEDDMWIW